MKSTLISKFKMSIAAVFLFSISNAFAKDTDHQQVSVQVKQEKREKSGINTKAGDGAGRPRLSTAEIYAVEIEKKLVEGIDKTIAYLNKTAKSLPKKSGARLEMLTRVHNLHMEQAVYVASDEYRRYEQLWDAWNKGGRKGREPKLDQARSRLHWQKVSSTGRNILREFPKNKGADVINFNQALSLSFLGQEKNAARAFTQLIQKFPNSPVAGDAYFSLGDYYFDRNDFRNAVNNFKLALKYRKSKRYGWALFKLGWCYYNLGKYRESLKFWKNTVSHSKRLGDKTGLKLKEEALRDLVYAFAELKEVESAISYFRANGGQRYIGQFLTLLAETFADQGAFKRSIKVWERLQSIIPRDPSAAIAQNEIISLYFELNDLNTVWRELNAYYTNYGRKSGWAVANEKKLVLETQVEIQKAMLYYAKVVHKNAQKRNNNSLYEHAVKGYRLYLSKYPKSREVAEVKFNLADIKFHQKEFRQSGVFYLEIAMMGKGKAKIYDSDGKPVADIHAKAAKYMLDSYSRDFEPEYKTIVKQKPNFSKPARTLSVRAKNLIKACENYSKWYPKDKKTVKTCDTFITEIYYRSNDKKMALRYLWLIATKYPESKEGVEAVENLIPLYKEDKKGLSIAVNKLLAIPSYQKGKIGKKLTALRRAAAIEAIASEKDKIKRAELYEKRAKQNPRDKDAPKFWNNAAVDYLAGGAAFKAIGAYVNLVKLYPSSELSKDAMLELGKLYDRRLDFNASANYYLTYAAKNPKAKESSGAIQRACDLQIAIGSSNAVQTCSRLIKTYPENAKEAFGHLVDNFWRAQKYSDMTNLINEVYLRRFKLSINERIISNYKIYKAYGGRGNAAEQAGKRIEALLRSSSKASGEALRYIGEIAFKKANVYLAPYLKESLRGGTVENMLASIKKKTASLERLEKAYGQVLNTKDSYWGIAAYHQIGFAYEQFTSLLKNPPAIKGAKISDVQKELSGSAAQAQKKAVDYYTAGLDIARKLSVYNEWPAKLKTSLARLQGKTVSFADWVITPDFVGSEVPEDVSSEVWVGR